MMLKNRMLDSCLLLFFILLAVLSKMSVFNMPYFWDENAYFDGALAVYNNHLNPFVEFWSYKPPFIFLLMAVAYKIFGYSVFITRLIISLFAGLSLCFTFLLGRKLYNSVVGFGAAVLLFFSPLFFAQSGLFHCAVPFTAISLAVLYYYFKNSIRLYWLFSVLLLLTKEIGVLVIISVSFYDLIIQKKNVKESVMRQMVLLSPLLVFVIWMLLNQKFLGWFLWPYNASFLNHPEFNLSYFQAILTNLFVIHYKAIIVFAIFISLVVTKLRRTIFLKKETLLFVILFCVSVIGASSLNGQNYYPLPRYFLFLYPLFFIFGSAAIFNLSRKRLVNFILLGTIVFFFMTSWRTNDSNYNGEMNLNYLDIVNAHKQTSLFLEKDYVDYVVFAQWPLKQSLSDVSRGYIAVGREVLGYGDIPGFERLKQSIEKRKIKSSDEAVLILVHPNDWRFNDSRHGWFRFFDEHKAELLKEIEIGIETVQIYRL